jgi:hypothetical protein
MNATGRLWAPTRTASCAALGTPSLTVTRMRTNIGALAYGQNKFTKSVVACVNTPRRGRPDAASGIRPVR